MMKLVAVVGLSALLLSLSTGCSGLSRTDEIRVAGEIMANPPAAVQLPADAVNAARRAPGTPGQAPRRGG